MYVVTHQHLILQNTYWAGDQDGLIAGLYIAYKFIEICNYIRIYIILYTYH